MNSNKYTKEIVDLIVLTFPSVKCYYEFDELFNTHYLEIEPKQEFDKNEALNILLDDLYFEFIEKYPSESIAFSTNNGKLNLSNVCYRKQGLKFESKPSLWDLIKIESKQRFEIDVNEEVEFYLDDEFACAA